MACTVACTAHAPSTRSAGAEMWPAQPLLNWRTRARPFSLLLLALRSVPAAPADGSLSHRCPRRRSQPAVTTAGAAGCHGHGGHRGASSARLRSHARHAAVQTARAQTDGACCLQVPRRKWRAGDGVSKVRTKQWKEVVRCPLRLDALSALAPPEVAGTPRSTPMTFDSVKRVAQKHGQLCVINADVSTLHFVQTPHGAPAGVLSLYMFTTV